MRSDIAQGDGMYKSTDGGRTWTRIGLADSQQIGRVLVDPRDPDVVFVAALGHPYGPNAERGVFRSRDGGRSWQKVLCKDENTGAIDLAFEPGNPDVIYASLWQTRRTPWHIYPPSNGPGGGLYKSTDGGEHWTALDRPRPARDQPGRIGLAVAPSRPQRVYAMVDVPEAGGLYRSDDGGATWTQASGDPRIWGRGWYFGGITVEPGEPRRGLRLQHRALPLGGRRQDLRAGQGRARRRRLPRALDRSAEPGAAHPRRRPGGGGLGRRRRHLELLVQPADRPVLPRDHRQPLPLLGLRLAAGLRRRRRPQPHQHLRRHRPHRVPRDDRRRRERRRRARPARIRRSSSAAGWTSSTCAPGRRGRSIPRSPIPTSTARPGRCRWSSRRAIRGCSTSRTSASSAPTTAASTGR